MHAVTAMGSKASMGLGPHRLSTRDKFQLVHHFQHRITVLPTSVLRVQIRIHVAHDNERVQGLARVMPKLELQVTEQQTFRMFDLLCGWLGHRFARLPLARRRSVSDRRRPLSQPLRIIPPLFV